RPSRVQNAIAAQPHDRMTTAWTDASYILWNCREDDTDRLRQTLPVRDFVLEPVTARRCETVVLRFPVILRFSPLGGDETLMFETVQGGVQRSLLDLQRISRQLLNAQQDAVPVQGTEGNCLENQEVERALQQFDGLSQSLS